LKLAICLVHVLHLGSTNQPPTIYGISGIHRIHVQPLPQSDEGNSSKLVAREKQLRDC
jgi:hypothetical protein